MQLIRHNMVYVSRLCALQLIKATLHSVNQGILLFIPYYVFFGGGEGGTKKKEKSSGNDQLTGHFQSFFLISPEQTVKLVQQT